MAVKKILIPTMLVFVSSCSTTLISKTEEEAVVNLESKFRLPASEEERAAIAYVNINEEDFQNVLQSKNIEQLHLRLQLRLDAIEEVYFRAREALIEFDTLLKESAEKKEDSEQFFKKIIESRLYSKLLALRENNLTRQGQIVYFYRKFFEVLNDKNATATEIEYAKDAFEFIGKYYRTLPRHFLVAHYQVALELNELDYDNKFWDAGLKRTVGMKRSPNDKLVSLFTFYHQNYESAEVQKEIAKVSKYVLSTKTDIDNEIKKSSYMIQGGLINGANLRVPQSQKIEPGTGPSGNITGNNFPKNVWSITYDDGPHPSYTNQIAKNLEEYGIKSTFFSLSKNVVKYPSVTLKLKEEGMEIANHSHDHPQLPKLNETQLDFQIISSTDKIKRVTGEKPRFFRCPYGAGTNVARVRSRIAKEDMIHVFWNVDSLDWQDHNPASIVARVKKQISLSKKGGGIILFHDIHPQSVVASKEIMKYLKQDKGAKVKPIGEIVDLLND